MKAEWKECKLGEIVSLEYGKSLSGYRESNGKYPVYGTNGKIGNTDSFLSPIPSIIIGRKGAYRGVHFSLHPFYVIDTAFYVKPKTDNLDLMFLYNFLLTQDINAMDSGSAIPSTDRHEIYDIDLLLPPLPEQWAIAGLLSSLDDKIDLLHRQNKTLEGMVEALWRKMFVEEAEPGWRKGKLGDELDIIMGQSPPGNTYNEDKKGMLFFQGRAEFGFRFPTARLYCSGPKRFAKQFDTLVSVRAPVGDINMAYEECCIGRGLAAVRHKQRFVSYTFYKIRSLKDDFDSFEQQGTVFGSIGKDDFNGIDTLIPEQKIVKQFDSIAKPLDDKIFSNSFQIRTLSRLRDTLLPKLMNGEVRVAV